MAVKKLSSNIQSLFSSSIHLFSYKRAVEELVYNALDANSNSIAIRINIQENKIQVVDNGNGISEEDFNLLGQRYATSKFVNMSRYQSAPNTYGFRGQALASIVDVSESVKITSRFNNSDRTWTKIFNKGRAKQTSETTARPSKGTTIEINKFLYNLKIQSKAVDYLNELNAIKTLLEQLSLVHTNVSFSLRDDSRNEIILKVPKSRDIYQTFKSLHDINKSDIQELQVEKGQYKAIAYIGKDSDHISRRHWIFLNNRIVCNAHLHKVIKNNLKKTYRHATHKKVKAKNADRVDDNVTSNRTPFYFLFIKCPYYDYEISNTPKQSTLEFKNWEQINKLIEKIVKFYTGDLKVNEVKRTTHTVGKTNEVLDETRGQVKEMLKKILGSFPRNPGVSQMHNGVKGKLIKRKKEKLKDISLSKILKAKQDKHCHEQDNNIENHPFDNVESNKSKRIQSKVKLPTTKMKSMKRIVCNKNKTPFKGIAKEKYKQKEKPKIKKHSFKVKTQKLKKDALVKAFEMGTDTVARRCHELAKKAKNCIPHKKKATREVFVSKTINYSNIISNNENISVRKRVEETIIHDYIPIKHGKLRRKILEPKKISHKTSHDLVKTILGPREKLKRFPVKEHTNLEFKKPLTESGLIQGTQLPELTYQSHNYINASYTNDKTDVSKDYESHKYVFSLKQNNYNISGSSIEKSVNSTDPVQSKYSTLPESKIKKAYNFNQMNKISDGYKFKSYNMISKRAKQFDFLNFSHEVSSHTIDFSESTNGYGDVPCEKNLVREGHDKTFEVVNLEEDQVSDTMYSNIGLTYTLEAYLEPELKKNRSTFDQLRTDVEYILDRTCLEKGCTPTSTIRLRTTKSTTSNEAENKKDSLNVMFVSNFNPSVIEDTSNDSVKHIEPLGVCEAILNGGNSPKIVFDSIENLNSDTFVINSNQFQDLMKNNGEIEPNVQQNCSPEDVIITNHSLEYAMNNIHYNFQEIATLIQDANLNIVQADNEHNVINEQRKEEKRLNINVNDFSLKNRPRFLPKGMSPIFKTRIMKSAQSHNDNDYFEEEIYNRFMDDIQLNTEIYEAHVQNPNDAATKAIDKVNHRLNKELASLTFNTQSLMEAKVLRQVDTKFIATIMKGKSDSSEYLVLFDQHAVHERIRLENNLADYFNDNGWISAKVDDVVLKLSKDEILYLHNYKEKFTPFGLHWTVLNNQEITLHAIPEAVLGKNPRPVEKVICAVKNLITEEVNIIRAQKGCASLFPKSIMDLVFSEACRYAIMFGDRLSESQCEELIRNLSLCKTPFQCAHGRPVMAVIMEITKETRNYQITKENLRAFSKPLI